MSFQAARPRTRRPTRTRPAPPSTPLELEGHAPSSGLEALRAFFATRGWTPHDFQERTWRAYLEGHSGMVIVPTGAGKTFAGCLGALAEAWEEHKLGTCSPGVRLLYVSPLRAVSRDIQHALELAVVGLRLPFRVEGRTGDTSSHVRTRQRTLLPEVLITTPESLSLMLSWEDASWRFASLRCVVVDEWHELLGSRRGTQLELCLARLRMFAPELRTWALTATLKNVAQAGQVVVGMRQTADIIQTLLARPIHLDACLPERVDAFPWAGYLGLAMLKPVLEFLDPAHATLLFTNTRSQAERWFSALWEERPAWRPFLALHHSSLEKEERERVEAGLKLGELRLVVCTSSLDLGVDFAPVERVVQIGSPKGVGRLIQRAGRSAHRPGAACRITCVPTHALELLEIAATRDAIQRGEIEPRVPLPEPLDVLSQHLVTCAIGGGVEPAAFLEEVRTTWTFRALSEDTLAKVIELVCQGGASLTAYPDFRRVEREGERLVVTQKPIILLHRANIGTIVSEQTLSLVLKNGARLGQIEEYFISRLNPGNRFVFAGRVLELVQVKDSVAYVKPSKSRTATTPHWSGGRLPLSTALAASLRRTFDQLRRLLETSGGPETPDALVQAPQTLPLELRCAWPVIRAQARLSRLPAQDRTLAELARTREGTHFFLYPFEGRLVHEGLAALLAVRLTRGRPATFTLTVNDYGLELFSTEWFPFLEVLRTLGPGALFNTESLLEDILESINLSELARRQFREVARVAGLIHQGLPGRGRTGRQLQTSAGLLYDVFVKYDPQHLLLQQARKEVLEQQLERSRLVATLERLGNAPLEVREVVRPTPLGFPLLADRISSVLSSETTEATLARFIEEWQAEES